MMDDKIYEEFINNNITDLPFDKSSKEYAKYKKTILHFGGEAIYVYSFKEKRMVYAKGWEELLGIKDEELNLLGLMKRTTPRYESFANEFYVKAINFILTKTENLTDYSFTLHTEKIHEKGHHVPLFSRVGILKASEGKIEVLVGFFQTIRTLKHGEIMQYDTYGPGIQELDDSLSEQFYNRITISGKEKEALFLAAKGFTFKEIAHKLNVSQSAIEKRILPLYKRFNVKSLPHLIDFAHNNHLL